MKKRKGGCHIYGLLDLKLRNNFDYTVKNIWIKGNKVCDLDKQSLIIFSNNRQDFEIIY